LALAGLYEMLQASRAFGSGFSAFGATFVALRAELVFALTQIYQSLDKFVPNHEVSIDSITAAHAPR